MSEAVHTTTEVPAIKAPAKRRKKPAKRKAAAAPVKAVGIYAGLTVKDCCAGCSANGCVISGKSYCAHPRKGGLHAADQQDDGALARRRDAEKVLGKQMLRVAE